jgi:PAS domain S-box-containing protein
MSRKSPSTPNFQALFEAAPGLYLVLLPDAPRYTIVAASDAYVRATMTRREDILGRGLFEVFPDNPADPTATGASNLGASLERVLAERVPDVMAVQQYDIRRPPESGGQFEERWWSPRNAPVFTPDGEVAYILHAVEDVTEKRHLAEERQLFAALVENSSDFIGIADPTGKPVYVNPAGRKMVGLSAEHPVGETRIPEYYPPEERAFASDAIIKEMIEHGRWSGEILFRNWKTGEAIPVLDEHFLIRDPGSGRTLGMGTVTRDITDRKRIEQALQESEERFRLTIDEAPIGMALVGLDGRFILVNRALCEIVGYSPAELTKLTFQSVTHPDDLDADLALVGRLTRGEIPRYQLAKRYFRKNGTIVDIMLSASILRDRDGAPLLYIAQIEDITERKRIERELQDINAFLDAIIENVPLMLFVKDSEALRFVRFNRAGQELLGWTNESLIGKSDYDFWPRAQADFFVEKDRETLKNGRVLDVAEEPIQTRHRGIRILHTKKVPVLDPDGKPLYLLGISEDITERKRTDEALRVSEAKFSGIVSISADAIISIGEDQRITIFNHGAEKIFGYSQAEAVGAPLDMLIPERFRKNHPQHVGAFAAGEVTARRMGERLTTIAGLRKNGEEFPAEAAISKLEVGDKTLLTVALRDVTERKRLEKELQFLAEAGAVLAATLDYEQTLAAVTRLVVRDFADWCIVEIKEDQGQLRRLKVVSADPAKAELCSRFEQIPIDRDRPYLLRAVVETRRPLLIERVTSEQLEAVAQGAEHREALRAVNPVSVMALPLLSHGELVGTLTFVSSSTSRLYGRADLGLAEALADRAAVAIENARLYRAAIQATELREQVLGFVAHDLRNPLNTILMQASTLQRRALEQERRSRKPGEIIDRAARRMNGLIQDLLDVARMEAGKLPVERAPMSARELVVEAVESQTPLAASSSLEIRLDLGHNLPEILGARDRLLRVFENLIGNAMKFTRAGGWIMVGAESREQEVVFWVADTGCGIAAESVSRVFDRFWQAGRAERHGAGLGLPIAKGIVEAHSGRIWVESTPGRGSTFFFSIPRAHPAVDRPSHVMH